MIGRTVGSLREMFLLTLLLCTLCLNNWTRLQSVHKGRRFALQEKHLPPLVFDSFGRAEAHRLRSLAVCLPVAGISFLRPWVEEIASLASGILLARCGNAGLRNAQHKE
jgi:hypothetical protein